MSDIIRRDSGMANHSVSATNSNFFTGSVQTGQGSLDPFVSGYAFVVWVNVPTWLSDAQEFIAMSQKNFKSFSGLQNIELETEGVRAGFTGNETHYTKGIGTKPAEFSLKYQMHSGDRLGGFYNEWVTGIRDPKTGTARYPKEFGLEYHSNNHTGSLLYVVTRPDADNFEGNNIEHASLWTHVQPKRIILDPYNFESGNHDFFENEQSFSGYFNFGQEVEKYAQKVIKEKVYPFISENAFTNISQYTG